MAHRLRFVESRLVTREVPELERTVLGRKIRAPQDMVDALSFLRDRTSEEFWIILLDIRHVLRAVAQVSKGSLTSSIVHPREVFGPALRENAAAIVVAHNHPSGDPVPSREDKAVTTKLLEAGKILGIPVLDHIIVGSGASFFSFQATGGLK